MTETHLPIMRKATAVWLVENTSLTFKQIADFCGLHELEIQGIADGDVAQNIIGQSPVFSGQLSEDEIKKCEKDENLKLVINKNAASEIKVNEKKSKYTPVARRQDKPDAILYLLKYHPELSNSHIKKIVGTTDAMIESIKNKTHWNMKNIKPRDVVLLGLCSQSQFNEILEKAKNQAENEIEKSKK